MAFLTVAMMAAAGAKAQGIALVPVFGLPDAAQADAKQRVIFYDPQQIREIGPDMAAFVIAREEAHVRLGHAAPEPGEKVDRELTMALERTADCLAAAAVAAGGAGSVERVIGFFERIGPLRPDDDHASGSERAATVRACAATAVRLGHRA